MTSADNSTHASASFGEDTLSGARALPLMSSTSDSSLLDLSDSLSSSAIFNQSLIFFSTLKYSIIYYIRRLACCPRCSVVAVATVDEICRRSADGPSRRTISLGHRPRTIRREVHFHPRPAAPEAVHFRPPAQPPSSSRLTAALAAASLARASSSASSCGDGVSSCS